MLHFSTIIIKEKQGMKNHFSMLLSVLVRLTDVWVCFGVWIMISTKPEMQGFSDRASSLYLRIMQSLSKLTLTCLPGEILACWSAHASLYYPVPSPGTTEGGKVNSKIFFLLSPSPFMFQGSKEPMYTTINSCLTCHDQFFYQFFFGRILQFLPFYRSFPPSPLDSRFTVD